MANTSGEMKVYIVEYLEDSVGHPIKRSNIVKLIEGYTTFDSIPLILDIANGHKNIEILSITRLPNTK